MKRLYKFLSATVLSLLLFTACSTEDTDFTGTDADILEFSLTVDGVKYVASVSDGVITITVPTDVDITRASVEYLLSERATIVPDPANVDNWSQERVFHIEGWRSRTIKTYTYLVKRTDIQQEGNVVLTTQAQLNSFAASKANTIKGNLIIGSAAEGSEDPVTDLSALATLKEVAYNVVINNSFAGTSLAGLENLEKAGGLYIGTETAKAATVSDFSVELPKLASISNVVVNCDNVTALALPKLESVASMLVTSNKLSSLNLSALKESLGNLSLNNLTASEVSLPALTAVGGNLTLSGFGSVANLNVPAIATISGDCSLNSLVAATKITLPKLTSIGGTLGMTGNSALKEFSFPLLSDAGAINLVFTTAAKIKKAAMPKLKNVSGGFTFNYYMGSSLELPALESVGGLLNFATHQFLEKLSVPALKRLNSLTLSNAGSLAALDLSAVSGVENITVSGCALLEFTGPQSISGNFTMSGQAPASIGGIKTVEGNFIANTTGLAILVKDLETIGGTFTLSTAASLTTLEMPALAKAGAINVSGTFNNVTSFKMPELASVDNNFNFRGMLIATDLDFKKLTTVGGTFTYYGGAYASYASRSLIENMDAFSSLTSASKVDIRYAGKLADFSGLKNVIPNITSADWTVMNCLYNPTWQDMVDGKYTNE